MYDFKSNEYVNLVTAEPRLSAGEKIYVRAFRGASRLLAYIDIYK